MKPLNANDPSCSPISSNCVIWQGPDIECIKLCKGDTISVVVYKLALELCRLMEQTNVSNYDLSCLNLASCAPDDFQALIQLLINRICALEDCCDGTTPTPGTNGCPDCVVNICSDFYYQNPQGDTITTMQLTDYVQAIGNRVCQLISQINTINAILVSYNERITALENAPAPVFNLPQVTPVCVLPSVPTDMNIVLAALEQQFCALIGATGGPNDIYQAIIKQCAALNTSPQLGGSGNMAALTGWASTVNNLADAISNIWLTMCDVRAAITSIQTNCCPTGCDGIALSMIAQLEGDILKIFISGTIPVGFVQCPPTGTTSFTISDQSGNSIVVQGDIIANLNSLTGIQINVGATVLNLADTLTVTANPCLFNESTNATCQSVLNYVVSAVGLCPVMTYSPSDTTIGYSGTVLAPGTATYTVEVWDVTMSVLIASQATLLNVPPAALLSGTFVGLTPSTSYKVRVTITPVVGTPTVCPFASVVTLAPLCPPPSNVVPQIVLS